ncbi:MoaD/ThiS family protein [Isachenkonia alkalipeptolytica]|uniref:MoaD/ThiS family protein n=1 Tax=Isachenkonia alkalipeptolytica TaxID=2565777 RepID=A0AA43XIR4_9CLOT|nr:MoaD/ThiS family protein [Isachenkonia alkalipeptolytica]NBG87196.1 MoaD/ThiS family protein [Isachenkonia alkalipeptolytica]
MGVKVKLFSKLREGREKEVCTKECMYDLTGSDTVEQAVEALNVNKEDIKILLVNGLDAELTTPLKDGDTVSVFPPTGGM